MLIRIGVSVGELFDRISILEIKASKIVDEARLRNVRKELEDLNGHKRAVMEAAGSSASRLIELTDALKAINARIWTLEDEIRSCERAKDFGDRFIELARGIYHSNDERSRIKRAISEMLDSAIIEEKSYTTY